PPYAEEFVRALLLSEQLLVGQGTAFNCPYPADFRVVTMPSVDELEQAIGRIGNFLKVYRQ
ncbi:aminotransferase, partial [Pseudomonas syringae]